MHDKFELAFYMSILFLFLKGVQLTNRYHILD